jgi:NADH-quinone oxidoreductase subunit J
LIGAVQIMVYAGSITVMFVFALMLAPTASGADESLDHSSRFRALAAAAATFVITALAVLAIPAARTGIGIADLDTVAIELFTGYAYPFELLALVLTSALVGVAVVVGRSSEAEAAQLAEDGDES